MIKDLCEFQQIEELVERIDKLRIEHNYSIFFTFVPLKNLLNHSKGVVHYAFCTDSALLNLAL